MGDLDTRTKKETLTKKGKVETGDDTLNRTSMKYS